MPATPVLVEVWLTGAHLGPLRHNGRALAPTGKGLRVRMAARFEFEPGSDQIVCERRSFDQAMAVRALLSA